MRFDMICEANGIEHRLTKSNAILPPVNAVHKWNFLACPIEAIPNEKSRHAEARIMVALREDGAPVA
jgi:hypothetical protein